MRAAASGTGWVRRAQPGLGTLVEVGVQAPSGAPSALQAEALRAAWRVMQTVQSRMSVFEADSDLSRLHRSAPGEAVVLHPWTAEVLALAQDVRDRSGGLFDVALGSGRWALQRGAGHTLAVRLDASTRLDLGGLAKGWAVDRALEAVLTVGAQAAWVNAGGDLRVHGVRMPVYLRDEARGGARAWAEIEEGAMATSDLRAGARSALHAPSDAKGCHVSVAAPRCALADALTKVVAAAGSVTSPVVDDLLRHCGAQAWIHPDA